MYIGHKLTGIVVAVYGQGNLSITVPRNEIWPCMLAYLYDTVTL